MTKDKAIKAVLESILNTEVGIKLPSYNSLSAKYKCSRSVFQHVMQELEDSNIVMLDKSKGGTKLVEIDYYKLLSTYYSNIFISCPRINLSNDYDEITLTLLKVLDNPLITSYFTYSDSTYQRYSQLTNDNVHLAIVTDVYYKQLDNDEYPILKKININIPTYTKLTIPDHNNTEYNIDEVPVLTLNDNDKIKNNYSAPHQYYLICKKSTYNLLSNTIV